MGRAREGEIYLSFARKICKNLVNLIIFCTFEA